MTITAPTPIADGPPVPNSNDPTTTFDAQFEASLEWQKDVLAPGVNAQSQAAYDNANSAHGDALAAQASAADAQAAAISSSASANATKWVSGTAYTDGQVVWSPATYLTYRRKGAGAGATDPSSDAVNWAPVNATAPFIGVTANTLQAVSGGRYSLQRTTTEGAGTNLLTYSDQLDNAAWTKSNVTVAANTTASPDGDVLADTVTTTGASPGVYSSITVAASSTNDYYGSVFVKKGTSSKVKLDVYYPGNTQSPLLFDFDTQVISGGAYAGEYIAEYVGDGWWRLGYRVLRDASASKTTMIILLTPNSGVVGQTIFVWGAQIEAGAAATSYIPSVASPGTRAAGIVPPQRVVLPAAPASNAFVSVQIGNGIDTNVIHPNGSTLEGTTGPALIDFTTGSVDFQYLNGTWRAV